MENIKSEFNSILISYQDKYIMSSNSNNGFESLSNNMKLYSKLFEEFADEITLKANEYINIFQKEDLIKLSQEVLLKFN